MEIVDNGRIVAKANLILTPELVAKIGAIHGTYMGGNGILVVARDYSNNSRMLKRAFMSGSMSTGLDILNLHSAPLPLVEFCIRRFGASGGVYFSSGGTYGGDTTIRFFDSSGIEFSESNMQSANELFKKNEINRVDPIRIGTISSILQTFEVYKKAIPQFIDKNVVTKAGLKVVMDCSHGPTGELGPEILNSINTNVIALNTYYRPLADKIYPNLQTVRDAASIVKASEANLGVVFDTDGSRMLVFDETGSLIDFEDIFMLFISNSESIQKSKSNPLITTTSCSRILDAYCETMGYKLRRMLNMPGTISKGIREERAAFGASDTLKFYFPQYGPFSDAILTLLKLLEIIAKKDEPLSSIIRSFPKTIKVHKTLNVTEDILFNFTIILKEKLKNRDVFIMDTLIGLKIVFEPGIWVKLKPSLYRNALIVTSEAPEQSISEKRIKEIEDILGI